MTTPTKPLRLLKSCEVAAMFRVTQSTVYRWIREGRLPCVRTPTGQLRFMPEQIIPLLRKSTP